MIKGPSGNCGCLVKQRIQSFISPLTFKPIGCETERKIRGNRRADAIPRHRERYEGDRRSSGRSRRPSPPVSPPPLSKSPFPFPSSSKNEKHKTLIPFSFFLQPICEDRRAPGRSRRPSPHVRISRIGGRRRIPVYFMFGFHLRHHHLLKLDHLIACSDFMFGFHVHVQICFGAITNIGFAVFMVHLATIPITGTGIIPDFEEGRMDDMQHPHE
ncbi:hypothetical protein LXL04_028183 [Taraxacum kok-saghyz]